VRNHCVVRALLEDVRNHGVVRDLLEDVRNWQGRIKKRVLFLSEEGIYTGAKVYFSDAVVHVMSHLQAGQCTQHDGFFTNMVCLYCTKVPRFSTQDNETKTFMQTLEFPHR
jgi:hypothetical protein